MHPSYGKAKPFLMRLQAAPPTDQCVEWPFRRDRRGYGLINLEGKTRQAHRVVCAMTYGAPPNATDHVAHSCDNPKCVNPRHLRWATQRENETDRFRHGKRHRPPLTVAEVRMIRRLRGVTKQAELARRLRVSANTIWEVQHGRIYRWVEAEDAA